MIIFQHDEYTLARPLALSFEGNIKSRAGNLTVRSVCHTESWSRVIMLAMPSCDYAEVLHGIIMAPSEMKSHTKKSRQPVQ